MPDVGVIEDGYRFTGGDPSKEENWEAVKLAEPPREKTLAQRAISAVSAKPGGYGIPRGVTKFLAAAPIPATTTALGIGAGALLAPVTGGIVNPVTGGMIGGGAGESINQKLGITEPSEETVLMNMAAPLIGKYIQPAFQTLRRLAAQNMPGAGFPLQERAAQLVPKIPIRPGQSSESLYRILEQYNPPIPSDAFRKSLTEMQGEVLNRLGESSQKTQLLNYLESKIVALDEFPTGDVPFKMLRATQKEINAKIGAREGGEELGILKQLARGIKTSFDEAAESRFAAQGAPEAVHVLRAANRAYVKERGAAELDKALTKSFTEHEGGVLTFSDTARRNIKKVLNTNEEIQAAYSKDEIAHMKEALDAIGPLPGLPPTPGTLFAGMRMAAPAVVGGVISPFVGVHPTAGVAVGMSLDLLLKKVVMSEWGRQRIIDYATTTGHRVPPEIIMSIASGITGGAGGILNPAQDVIRPPTGAIPTQIQPAFANQP